MVDDGLATDNMTSALTQYVRSEVPGLQYIAVTAERVLFEYAGGWADILATVVLANSTEFSSSGFLNRVDGTFLESSRQ